MKITNSHIKIIAINTTEKWFYESNGLVYTCDSMNRGGKNE